MSSPTEEIGVEIDRLMKMERRRSERKPVIRGGKIIYNEGHCTLDCRIKNLSSTGARLDLPMYTQLPETFVLMFADGSKRPAEISWSRMTRVGIRFLDIQGDDSTTDLQQILLLRILKLEQQVDELRNEVLIHIKP